MKKVTTFVISAHLLVILLLLFMPAKKKPKALKHVVVRTVQPMKAVASHIRYTSPPKQKKAAVVSQKTSPPPKSSTKKTAVVEKNKPKVAKPRKEVEKNDQPLAKITTKAYPVPKPKLDVPQMELSVGEESQDEGLAGFLHSSLHLPEFGEVTIQLTVKRDGTVARLVVLKTESKKNRAYLEQHLPVLKFPLILEGEKTFTLTFCNEI